MRWTPLVGSWTGRGESERSAQHEQQRSHYRSLTLHPLPETPGGRGTSQPLRQRTAAVPPAPTSSAIAHSIAAAPSTDPKAPNTSGSTTWLLFMIVVRT